MTPKSNEATTSAAWLQERDHLNDDVARLEKERDALKGQVIAVGNMGDVHLAQAEAQLRSESLRLGEAVGLLHLSKCIGQNPDSNADYYCWMHGGPKEEYCPRCTFLASLTEEPKHDHSTHRRIDAKPMSKLDYQPCVRVWWATPTMGWHKCDRHGCPWPKGGECPWNTPPPGRPVADSGPRPVGGRE